MKPVLIIWEDSLQAIPNWQFLEDVAEPNCAVCQTAGFIIKENKQAISIAQTLTIDNEQCMGLTRIPKSCIQKIIKL